MPPRERELRPYPARVYAPDEQTALDYGGPDCVAVQDFKAVLPVALVARLKRAVAYLRWDSTTDSIGLDESRLVEMGLEYILDQVEDALNNGEPFPDVVKAPPTPRRPIPRAKAKP